MRVRIGYCDDCRDGTVLASWNALTACMHMLNSSACSTAIISIGAMLCMHVTRWRLLPGSMPRSYRHMQAWCYLLPLCGAVRASKLVAVQCLVVLASAGLLLRMPSALLS